VGGDGTLHEIVNGLLRTPQPPELAAIPVGTGNDFAHCLGIPKSILEAVALACKGTCSLATDVGLCGDRYFLNVAGIGFDADVAMAVNRAPGVLRRLPYAFVLYTLRELVRNRRHPLDIYLDGRHVQRQSLLVAVANGRFYAGGMMIAPPASRSDGLLDVCIIGDVSRREVLRLLPSVFHGGHIKHPKVELHRARVVRIEGLPTTLAQLDGEVIGSAPLQFEVVPRALTIVVPHLQ
jgi:YegS/Rv2252/BmrU family lipid kinase